MDLETFIQALLAFVKNCDNAYFLLYAVATCLLTQVVKKLFVNKISVDVLHKFDFAVVLPFVFGAIFAVVDVFIVRGADTLSFGVVADCGVSCATIGALATVIFKFCASLSGKSLKSLLKDDLFGAFYTQLLYFGTVREQLLNKELTLADFISSVKLLCENASKIYQGNDTAEKKREKLFNLLRGVVDDQSIDICLNVLDRALSVIYNEKTE